MDEITKSSKGQEISISIIGLFFYLSSVESFLIFLYYVGNYQKYGWWSHPTTIGIIILSSLFLGSMISGVLGYYTSTHAQKASDYINRLKARSLDLLLLVVLVLFLVISILIALHMSFLVSTPLRAVYKHPALHFLAILSSLSAIISVASLRIKNIELAFQSFTASVSRLAGIFTLKRWSPLAVGTFLKRNRLHFIVWIVMIIYLIAAPQLNARFFLTEGKPIELTQTLPAPSDQIKFHVDGLDSTTYNNQQVYNLFGWSFYLGEPDQALFDRFIVLQSESDTYFFPLKSTKRSSVQEVFKDLNLDLLYSGYSAFISKDSIRPGTYRVGILFKPKVGESIYFYLSVYSIVRSANQMTLHQPSAWTGLLNHYPYASNEYYSEFAPWNYTSGSISHIKQWICCQVDING